MFGKFWGYFDKWNFSYTTSVDSFWATVGKIGLILIPTSGHTASQLRPPQKMGTPNFGRREFEIFISSFASVSLIVLLKLLLGSIKSASLMTV